MSNDLKNGVSMQIYRLEAENASLREQLAKERELRKELVDGLISLLPVATHGFLSLESFYEKKFKVEWKEAIEHAQSLIQKAKDYEAKA